MNKTHVSSHVFFKCFDLRLLISVQFSLASRLFSCYYELVLIGHYLFFIKNWREYSRLIISRSFFSESRSFNSSLSGIQYQNFQDLKFFFLVSIQTIPRRIQRARKKLYIKTRTLRADCSPLHGF